MTYLTYIQCMMNWLFADRFLKQVLLFADEPSDDPPLLS